MSEDQVPADEQPFGSTRWAWRRVKVRPAPQAHPSARRRRSMWISLPRGGRGRSWTMTVTWRGGAEAWWLVDARGKKQAVPGWLPIEDLMALVLNEAGPPPR